MTTSNTVSQEIPAVNLVRGFSIFAVLAFHIGLNCRPTPWPWLSNLWVNFALRGMYGVTVFFLVSGFLITKTIANKKEGLFHPNFRAFYARRAGRILPLLFFMLLLGASLIWVVPTYPSYFASFFNASSKPLDLSFWGSILTFSFNWNMILNEKISPGGYGLYWGILWSLSVEEQFYVGYPILLKCIKNRSSLIRLLVFLVVLGPLVRFGAYQIDPTRYFLGFMDSFGCFDLMAMGILLYLTQEKWQTFLLKNRTLSIVLAGLGLALALSAYFLTAPQDIGRVYGPTLLGFGVFSFLLGAMNLNFFERDFFVLAGFPGKLSYGLYLLHVSVIYFLWSWLPHWDTLIAFTVLGCCALAIAYLSYRFFELPANRWVRRTFGG